MKINEIGNRLARETTRMLSKSDFLSIRAINRRYRTFDP